MSVFTIENEAFKALAYYGVLLLGKTAAMSILTAYQRITKNSFANIEDTKIAASNAEKRKAMLHPNDSVERVRRAHLNDLENIIPFFLIGLTYLSTGPDTASAILRFKIFFWARILHTICYVGQFPQPTRGLTFFAGFGVNIEMVVRTFLALR